MKTIAEKIRGSLWYFGIYIVAALGMASVLFTNLGVIIPVREVFLWLTVVFVILELCLRKWYLLPALLLVTVGTGVVVYLQNGNLYNKLTVSFEILFQYLEGYTFPESVLAEMQIPLMMIALPSIGLIMYLLAVKINSFLPFSAVIVSFYAFAQIIWWTGIYNWAMAAVVAVFAKMALSSFRKDESNPSPGIAAAAAAAVALIAVVFASPSIKDVKYPLDRSWRWLRMQVSDIGDALFNTTGLAVLSMPRDLFSTDKAGYSMHGGPVVTDDIPFLLVEAPDHTLLRGSIQNYYTGSQWINTVPKTQYRFESSFWQKELDETYSLNPAKWDELSGELQRLLSIDTIIRVQHLRQDTSSLYGAGRVYEVRSNVGDAIIPYFDMNGDMFSKYYVNAKASYSVKTYLVNYGTIRLDYLMSQVTETRGEYDEWYEKYYLQLPDTLPEEIYSLTSEIIKDTGSDYSKALAIRDYLSEFSYTLSPSVIPGDTDFVDYFLKTREGYCVYYASAMTVMARCAGIPSRYVQGFYVPKHPYGKSVFLTGENAHAWAELYFEGIGWMPFDATPRAADDEYDLISGDPIYIPILTPPPPEEYPFTDFDLYPDDLTGGWFDRERVIRSTVIILIILALVSVLTMPYILLKTDLSKRRILKRFPDIRIRLERYYANMRALLLEFDSSILPGDTPYMVAGKVEKHSITGQFFPINVWEITNCLVRMRYEDIPPSEEDFKVVHDGTLVLEKEYRKLKGFYGYYRSRAVGRTVFRKPRRNIHISLSLKNRIKREDNG